ncbi:MAG: carboxypeptidase-like regulatory domain-containing protein [Niabella sp.]
MRLLTIVFFLFCIQAVAAPGYSQYVTLNCKNEKLESVLNKIEKQTGYSFFYNDQLLQHTEKVNLSATRLSLNSVLNKILYPRGLGYSIDGKYIVITKQNQPVADISNQSNANIRTNINTIFIQEPAFLPIKGTVKNESGEPIAGASVLILGGRTGMSTNAKGEFTLDVGIGQTIVISAVGYEEQQIKVTSASPINIVLVQDVVTGETVVINTGMYTRKKETYTGSAATFSGEDLRRIGNQNLIQSLRSLDPSFLIMENNLAGSNPNVLPTIELRGQTSITTNSLADEFSNNPNQPLFILDGFESSLKAIQDLDMNQIASINVLKDASATSIYGSKASNGVIVVETLRPTSGSLRIRYIGDFNFQFPDLSSYNMMNAAEKLEFERLSGVYKAPIGDPELQNSYYDPMYAEKLQMVQSGVNTYWLSAPLQTGFSQKHSLYADGGSENFSYTVGGSYKDLKGVMIGSGNKEWNGRVNLTYRKNKLNINNNLLISGYRQDESNYGSFSTWANALPYFKKADNQTKYLFEFVNYNYSAYGNAGVIRVVNPYYNALLNSFNYTKNFAITNNFQLVYKLNNNFEFQGGLQLVGANTESNEFVSPRDTRFDNTANLKKRYL